MSALAKLQRALERQPMVDRITHQLAERDRRNHFAEQLEEIMRRRREHP